jgi:hypothetical protein
LFALHALKELAITARSADRFPQQCTVDDLTSADFVVAVKEAEHRPLIRERFAKWEHLPDYWNVAKLALMRRNFRRTGGRLGWLAVGAPHFVWVSSEPEPP